MNKETLGQKCIIPRIESFSFAENFDENRIISAVRNNGCRMKIDKVNWSEYPYAPDVSAHLAHDGEKLYCLYDVCENHVRVETTADNGPVWEDSCVEFFVADPDGKHYYNFETNAIGTALASRRISRTECKHFAPDKIELITRLSSLPHERTDLYSDDGIKWQLLVAIPFCLMGYEDGNAPKSMRINLYKCGDKTRVPHFLSWASIATPAPDFHRPEFFETVALEQ